MRHLFIIQCHEFSPAIYLGKLIHDISSNFGVMYAYDERSRDSDKFSDLPNSVGFTIGYFTLDQGLYHLNLWRIINSDRRFNGYDYYHIISQNDLPFKGITKIDELIGDSKFYGFYWQPKFKDVDRLLYKGLTWYGISNEAVKYIAQNFDLICTEIILSVWKVYSSNLHINVGFTGSLDEYIIGWLLNRLSEQFTNYLSQPLRFTYFPESDRIHVCGSNKLVTHYGKLSDNKTSPISLLPTEETVTGFLYYDVLFGRKFEYNSESYHIFVNYIRNGFKI